MEGKDEFKKIHIKNRTCYYFVDIMRLVDINFSGILLNKKSYENEMTFYTKLSRVPTHCVFGSKKWMDLLKFMMELDI